ncbi:MAG TPA: GH3 auxin-responsive promoter family protein [Drouetiella sp.]
MQNKSFVSIFLGAIKGVCYFPHARFIKSLSSPKDAQTKVFQKLVKSIARTEFGEAHKITGREDYEQFVQKIPVRTYREAEPWIQKQIARRNDRIISPDRIVHVETTSGSTSARKRIPYTNSLISTFSNMFAIWAYDLLSTQLQLRTGKIFISVSPKSPNTKSSADFTSDDQYLKEPLRSLVSGFLVSPTSKNNWTNFQQDLALTLMRNPDLEIISIWSPTYLISLMQYVESHKRELEELLGRDIPTHGHSRSVDWSRVFPNLQLISCWDSASAKLSALKLRKKFPGVKIQGKGLLSTEAPITVPLAEANDGCVPLLNDVFFEFEDSQQKVHRLDELTLDCKYEVIVSQMSGLTRYRTNDIVRVTGFQKSTPILDFVARSNATCDLVGEKLSEEFVRSTLAPVLRNKKFILVPRLRETAAYLLLLDAADDAALRAIECFEKCDQDFRPLDQTISDLTDEALQTSYHYKLAKEQRQLAPVRTLFVDDLNDLFQTFQMQEGIKFGDIKETYLVTDLDKANRFIQFVSGSLGKTRLQSQSITVQTDVLAQASSLLTPIPVGT